ncbi:hypothetical protein [Jeotgalibacillus soli]|uniref:Uncharacterized protein n=1 Tax=Jeotgalibacillus soli TaxID=889306 RepID=A0A0C2VZF0_9BACL|nr:hypothetical protein [Jeotgalibacillus soli]KIL49338.1 hypothetical protein KP78_08060 [Jeotgalibacillus soli]
MKKSTKNIMAGSILSAGAAVAVAAYQKKKKGESSRESFEVLEDTDMRNSEKVDQEESVNAAQEAEEAGLTKLDSAYRADWQANGFPQTHQEMEELEKEEQK